MTGCSFKGPEIATIGVAKNNSIGELERTVDGQERLFAHARMLLS